MSVVLGEPTAEGLQTKGELGLGSCSFLSLGERFSTMRMSFDLSCKTKTITKPIDSAFSVSSGEGRGRRPRR